MHHLLDLHRALGAQDPVEVDRSEQLEGRVDDEDLVKILREVLVLAHVVDRLADRPERRHGDELRLHAPSGGLFGIIERATQPDAFGEGQLRQDLFLVGLVEILENVDRVVRIEFLDRLRDLRIGHRIDDLHADRLVDLGQRAKIEVGAHEIDQRPALIRHQCLEKVTEFGLVEVRHITLERDGVAVCDGRADMCQEGGADDAFLVVDVGAFPLRFLAGGRVFPNLRQIATPRCLLDRKMCPGLARPAPELKA